MKWSDNFDNDILIGNINKKIKKKYDDEDNFTEQDETDTEVLDIDENTNKFSVNMHTPSSKIMNAIVDLIDYYKWEFVTILFQESLGLEHIQNLIRIPSVINIEKLSRTNVRQLSGDINEWGYLLKDIKLSGSSHIIVDIETKYINEFIRQVKIETGGNLNGFIYSFINLGN